MMFEGTLPGRNPGSRACFDTLRHAIDLRVDDVARDFDRDLLLRLADVLEFGFHGR